MRRRSLAAFLVAFAVGAGFLLVRSSTSERAEVFPVRTGPPLVFVPPSGFVCQRNIELIAPVHGVTFPVDTRGRPGPPLTVSVHTEEGRRLATGRVRGGYAHGGLQEARFRRLPAGQSVSVCVRRTGAPAGPGVRSDLTLAFLHREPTSTVGLLPTIFERMALFRFECVGAWTFWVLLALLVLAAPALCAYAVARAAGNDEDAAGSG